MKSFSPSGSIVQQHQYGKQAIAGWQWQTVHGAFCQTITKSCQIITNNIEKTLQDCFH